MTLHETLMQAALSALLRQWQISQSDCEISSNRGKIKHIDQIMNKVLLLQSYIVSRPD